MDIRTVPDYDGLEATKRILADNAERPDPEFYDVRS